MSTPERCPSEYLITHRLDIAAVLDALEGEGATSMPILSRDGRAQLLREARRAPYRKARQEVGSRPRLVRQRMEVSDDFRPGSPFHDVTREFQALWDASLARVDPPPFPSPLRFDDLMLQRYSPGAEGITPHRDHVRYINLVALFVLCGHGRFAVCEDREGTGAVEIANGPGDVVLMRAPGFMGTGERPFHLVRDITRTRYVFGLRQLARMSHRDLE